MKTPKLFFSICIALLSFISLNAQQGVISTYRNELRHEIYRPAGEVDGVQKPVKNIILMIGDGMGINQLAATMFTHDNELTVTQIPTLGMVCTQSSDRFTTDSAASGTAYATGKKTYNGAIGVDPDTNRIANIPEILAPLRIVSGVVTTDHIFGATPAAFFAHQPQRNMAGEILRDLPDGSLSFVAGGSVETFEKVFPEYTEILPQAGFTVLHDYHAVPQHHQSDRIAYVTPAGVPKLIKDGRPDFLPVTTRYAMDFLSNKPSEGFFLMVEGACIDTGGHANDLETVITETLDFDQAIAEALKFADKDGETLVIVTADHETGGMSILRGDISSSELEVCFTTKGHSPVMVPVFAYGPCSDRFRGIMENTEIMEKIISLLKK
ncbi:MAG: alkaline phosphatase [Bacteroides sp.]|nr:alkaline phosphatase [Bacteroides sp.]